MQRSQFFLLCVTPVITARLFFSPANGDVRDFFPVNTDILQNENFIFLMFPGDDTEWGILLLLLWVLNSKFTDGNFYFL